MEPNAGSPLVNLLEKYVQIVTADGRIFVGFLRGLDQTLNAVLSQCQQRIYSTDNDVQIEPLGLFFLRGDTIVMMGQLDQAQQNDDKWIHEKAEPLRPINMQ